LRIASIWRRCTIPITSKAFKRRVSCSQGAPPGAVFDTAFHHSLSEMAYLYAVPYHLYGGIASGAMVFTEPRTLCRLSLSRPAPAEPEQTHVITLHLVTAARRLPSAEAPRWTRRWA